MFLQSGPIRMAASSIVSRQRLIRPWRFFALKCYLTIGVGLAMLPLEVVWGQEGENPEIREIFRIYCGRCHLESDENGINYITNLEMLVEQKKVVPGEPEKSPVWQLLNSSSNPMPPEGEEPRPSAADRELIREWILALQPNSSEAKTPPSQPTPEAAEGRKPVSTAMLIEAVHSWLEKLPPGERRHQRFLVLNHLHNLPTRDGDQKIGWNREDLDLLRAAVSKAINSLSWAPQIVVPKFVDAEQTVVAIDLREIGWEANLRKGRPDLWNILLEKYPYGLKHNGYFDEAVSEKAIAIEDMTGSFLPWIRADWFVANSLQPENYHALLYDAVLPGLREKEPKLGSHLDDRQLPEQPMNVSELYDLLQVDAVGNLRRQRAVRAGFTRSGVSSQPRLIERHPATYGFLWGSLDFAPGNPSMNVLARPLGPEGVFDPERFGQQAFRHDGGEYIYALPNGLHGYLLANSNGDRLNFGPQEIVEDRSRILGNAIIANGLSCIACHKQGLITDFRDEVRFGIEGLPAEARQVVRKVYPDRRDLDLLIERDLAGYRAAVSEAILPFLDENHRAAMQSGGPLIEPVAPVAKRFLRDTIGLELMAHELGVSPETLRKAIEFSQPLRTAGLVAVLNGGTINREIWESGKAESLYQLTARTLRLGTPASIQGENWRGRGK